ncbi:MAG TPA: aldo/keto reductase [Candidatus Binatia bacterium]|jgi:aryl-alcohol dehydrogenase-like predicted oxidoreductase|nr:aldo/keto reductase [Candidatus Binatia bacterium]
MNYRQLGNSGVRVSVIGLGANRFGSENVPQAEVNRIIDAALDSGINFIDTSNNYTGGQSEETLGHALKGRGDKVVLATKFSFPRKDGPNTWGASRYQMMQALEGSLRRLQADHIDLYYAHRWDDTTPIEETLRAFDDLVRVGKVRYIGASAYASWQLAHANVLAELRDWTPFVVLQSEYNLLDRGVEREVLPYCRAHRVGFVPYHPLAGGFLTGKYEKGKPPPAGSRGERDRYVQRCLTDRNYNIVKHLATWADRRGRKINELAQAWLLAQPQVCSVITGATKVEHVLSNVDGADWALTAEESEEVSAMLKGGCADSP